MLIYCIKSLILSYYHYHLNYERKSFNLTYIPLFIITIIIKWQRTQINSTVKKADNSFSL